MTRFARAKGSKASNEKLPEEATSWQVMRQQLLEKQNANKVPEPKRREKFYFDFKGSAATSEWAEFETSRKETVKKNGSSKQEESDYSGGKKDLHKQSHQSDKIQKKSKNKSSKRINKIFEVTPILDDTVDALSEVTKDAVVKQQKKKKKHKKKQNISEDRPSLDEIDGEINIHNQMLLERESTGLQESTLNKKDKKKKNISKRIKKNNELQNMFVVTDFEPNEVKNQWSKPDRFNKNSQNRETNSRQFKYGDNQYEQRKAYKTREVMYINGKEVEVANYGGFPVKKEDAIRLKQLRKNLLTNGISKEDVDATMKLERRKAEKALVRERKKVCFHCRNAGHMFSDCPELGNTNDAGTGLCFKCGSTEHTHYECKVVRGEDYRHASCFICKEQGHIARQCPDNPRGLYPKGGACNVCGDVTHLKKDCPDLLEKKEGETMTLETLNSNAVEVLDEDIKKTRTVIPNNDMKKKSVVKF